MFCFLYQHFAWSVRTVLIHNTRGGPEAPITHHSRTKSLQEGTMHRLPKSPWSVFARVKLLHNYLCGAVSTNYTWHKTWGGFLSNDESPSPMKETGVQLELKIQCLPVSARMQDWIMPWTTFPLTADQAVHIHGKLSSWFIHSLNVYLSV